MYMVASLIISTYTNSSLGDFVQSRIFNRLNMTSSTYSLDTAISSGRFTQTWNSNFRRMPYWVLPNELEIDSGPGGAISTAEDLVRSLFLVLDEYSSSTTHHWIDQVGENVVEYGS